MKSTGQLAPIKAIALDCHTCTAYVGTEANQIFGVKLLDGDNSDNVRHLSGGHGGELWGLAVHPFASIALTAGDDKMIRCWDLSGYTELVEKSQGKPSSLSTRTCNCAI